VLAVTRYSATTVEKPIEADHDHVDAEEAGADVERGHECLEQRAREHQIGCQKERDQPAEAHAQKEHSDAVNIEVRLALGPQIIARRKQNTDEYSGRCDTSDIDGEIENVRIGRREKFSHVSLHFSCVRLADA
jgi:hypothetical protein